MIKPLSWSFTIVIKDQFLIISQYLIKKWLISILQTQHWTNFQTSNSLTFTKFKWNAFYKFLRTEEAEVDNDIIYVHVQQPWGTNFKHQSNDYV